MLWTDVYTPLTSIIKELLFKHKFDKSMVKSLSKILKSINKVLENTIDGG